MSFSPKEARELVHIIDAELDTLPLRTEVLSVDFGNNYTWLYDVPELKETIKVGIHVYDEITRPDKYGNRKELYITDFDEWLNVLFYISSGVLVYCLRDKPNQKPKVRKVRQVTPYKRRKEASEDERESDFRSSDTASETGSGQD